MIAKIKTDAKSKGACKFIDNANTIDEMVDLMFAPQGREFCQNTNYLKASSLAPIADDVDGKGVYIGKRHVLSTNHRNAFIGSHGRVICQGTDAAYHIIIADNSHVEIVATNYAVVVVTLISGEYNITKDNTSRIL